MKAARDGHTEEVSLLVNSGADINEQDRVRSSTVATLSDYSNLCQCYLLYYIV